MPLADGYSFGSNPWEQFKFEYNPDKPNPWYNLAFSDIPRIQSQIGFAGQLEPTRQASILNLLNQQGQGGRQARVDQFRRQSEKRRKQGASSALQQLRAQGLGGSGLEAGLSLDALNRSASETSDYQSQVEDPNNILAALMQILGAGQQVNMGATPELYGMASQMQQLRSAGEAQNAANRKNSGFMGALGQILGMVSGGGGLGSIFGGGGGGSAMPDWPLSGVPGYFGGGGGYGGNTSGYSGSTVGRR